MAVLPEEESPLNFEVGQPPAPANYGEEVWRIGLDLLGGAYDRTESNHKATLVTNSRSYFSALRTR